MLLECLCVSRIPSKAKVEWNGEGGRRWGNELGKADAVRSFTLRKTGSHWMETSVALLPTQHPFLTFYHTSIFPLPFSPCGLGGADQTSWSGFGHPGLANQNPGHSDWFRGGHLTHIKPKIQFQDFHWNKWKEECSFCLGCQVDKVNLEFSATIVASWSNSLPQHDANTEPRDGKTQNPIHIIWAPGSSPAWS